jgi:alpha-galactosidase
MHACSIPSPVEPSPRENRFTRPLGLLAVWISFLALSAVLCGRASGQDPKAQAEMQRWVSATFLGVPQATAPAAYLLPGPLKPNSVGETVMRNSIQGHPLLIAGRSFDHGVAMRTEWMLTNTPGGPLGPVSSSRTGEVRVVLPAGSRRFSAVVGVDSNDVTGYSNVGRGSVVATVTAGSSELFHSAVLHEGMQGVPVNVDLHGLREFSLQLAAVGARTAADQQDWDQVDWANAEVTMEDGSTLRLGDLPVGLPGAPASGDEPFSFVYDGRQSTELLKHWDVKRATRQLDEKRTEYTVTYTDSVTKLIVRAVAVAYTDFPTVEWTVYFKNGGTERTPILQKIQTLDASFAGDAGAEPVLHHTEGSDVHATDFRPFATGLRPSTSQQFQSRGGRPTDGDMPYLNLAWPGHGLIAVLGWPGQWAFQVARNESTGVRITGGQEETHFWLAPGEEVRTPLAVLQLWTGDWLDGQNVWRSWMLEHNVPRIRGKLPPPQLAISSSHQTGMMQWATEENQKEYLSRAAADGLPFDYWWMDAGWYSFSTIWWQPDTWKPDPNRFAHGLRAVDDAVHAQGRKVIVWFEPERVVTGSRLEKNHPEWLLGRKDEWQLLFLGNPDAWHWLVEEVSHRIESDKIDSYRQDFNFEPLALWRSHDTPDRAGITEIEHVEGYLAFFDELHRRFPDLMIDTCASGGRRLDLETLRRAVPLWRSDFASDPAGMQMQTYGLSLWVPYYGTAVDSTDPYVFRSQMTPAVVYDMDLAKTPAQREALLKLLGQWKANANFYYDDYYPLTDYSTEESSWMAWQFARSDKTTGTVQVFRRKESPFESAHLKLRGLDPKSRYVVTNPDTAGESTFTGAELLEQGLPVSISAKPGALMLLYRETGP